MRCIQVAVCNGMIGWRLFQRVLLNETVVIFVLINKWHLVNKDND